MNDERLNFRELAARLRIKPCTVRAWQREGLPYLPCGKLRFYCLTEVEKWLKERDVTQKQKRDAKRTAKATKQECREAA